MKTPFVTVTPWPVWSSFDGVTQLEAQLGAQPVNIDPTAAAKYGIPGTVTGNAAVGITERQYIQFSSMEGQAARRNVIGNNANVPGLCVGAATSCTTGSVSPGGSRWFQGANETVDHPTYSIRVGSGLTGVDTILAPLNTVQNRPDQPQTPSTGANATAVQYFAYGAGGLGREADVVLTWGAVARSRSTTSRTTWMCPSRPTSTRPTASSRTPMVMAG